MESIFLERKFGILSDRLFITLVGKRIKASFQSRKWKGENGAIYGMQSEVKDTMCVKTASSIIVKPYEPNKQVAPNKAIRSKAVTSAIGVITKAAINEMETIMTVGAPTRDVDTATSPRIRGPTIVTAVPTCFGNRTPASRTTSNIMIIIITSKASGNGTDSLATVSGTIKDDGIKALLKFTAEM